MARPRSRVISGPRRLSLWIGFQPAVATMAAGGTVLVATLNDAAKALAPFTIVRTHFALDLVSDQAAAIEVQSTGFGLAVLSEQAVAIGVTAVPTPLTDISSSLWFVHRVLFADESNLTDRTRPSRFWEVDSKAMRKVEAGQDVGVIVENDVGVGAVLRLGGRMLIKTN